MTGKRSQVSACASLCAVRHPLTRRSELGTRGVSVVRSRKKEREALESRVKVREAEADAVLESADSPVPEDADALAPRAAASQAPRAAASPVPRAAVSMPGSGGKHRQLAPARVLCGLRELATPRVRQVAKAALGGVRTPTLLTRTVAGVQDVGARTKAPTSLACSVPLTELLRGQGLTTALLLVARTTTGATPLRRPATSSTATPSASAASAASATTAASAASSTATTSATSAPTATAATASASTAATDTSTPTSTPTATPTPPAASTSTSTAPARSSSAPAPFALARAASPARGRRSTDGLKPKEVGRSDRGNRGQKGGGGAPLKDGGARVTTRGPYNNYALLGR
ncbi:unnamed protein product [Closterium sp. NIES-53]